MSSAAEPAWLATDRAAADTEASRLGVPDRSREEWKYLDGSNFQDSPDPIPEATVAELARIHALPEAAEVLVFAGGVFRPDLSRRLPKEGKICVSTLSECMDSPWLPGLPGRIDPSDNFCFAENRASWTDGLCVHVPEGAEPRGPVQILEIGSGSSSLRHLAILDKGAKLSLFQTMASPEGTPSTSRGVLQVELAPGANLSHARHASPGGLGRIWSGLVARIESDATFTSCQFLTSGSVVRTETFVELAGPGASADLGGLSSLAGERVGDVLTVVRHAKPHGTSNQLFQALADDSSTATFLGIVHVEKDAQKTAARQSSRNLVLARSARIHSRPQLEIWADDVKCSHGSTTGRLDEKALFFLRARGFSEAGAKAVLVRAFAGEQVEKLPEGTFRERVEAALEVAL